MSNVMRRIIITTLFAALLAAGGRQAMGFSLLGPRTDTTGLPSTYGDSWQTTVIGYDENSDIGTPKNIGQEYRHNTPVMYFGFDSTFAGIGSSGFFGLQGEQAVSAAFDILNKTFTNNSLETLDGYSSNLVEFPFNSQSYNYTAESLGITDIKSYVLFLMVEELGLAEPERYTWTLHDRVLPAGAPPCPFGEEYLVVQRNYYYTATPLTNIVYSPYVNDTLYTYEIEEGCTGPDPLAIAAPIPVDPDYYGAYTAVAGAGAGLGVDAVSAGSAFTPWASLDTGGFYTGLTADDVGGLRYLMSTNTLLYEDPAANAQMELTNFTLQPLMTQPLGPLLQFAQTNPPAALQALYPNLVIDSVSNYYTFVTNWTVGSYFTNFPGQQQGTAPTFIIVSNNPTFTYQTNYSYTFGNMVIVSYSSNTYAQVVTTTLGGQLGQQYTGQFQTNVTSQRIVLNEPSGQFYLVPTNSCGLDIVVTNKLNAFDGTYTNSIISATNTTSLGTGFVGTQMIIESLTNSYFQYYGCSFTTNGPSWYQGIGSIHFVRIPDGDIDPTSLALYTPITNTYSMTWYDPTNYRYGKRIFQRVIQQPDILFSARDIASPNSPHPIPIGVAYGTRSTPNWDLNNILPNLAGPGVMNPPIQIVLDDVGDIYGNGSLAEELIATNGFLDEQT
ncbi:MAG: hypothetical protein ACREE6_10540, partial [Limisphaerales bacterium]